MFTKRIIPCLDVNQGRVVKGVNFVNLRDAGDPVEIAAAYDKAGADELVFLDITATSDARELCGAALVLFTQGKGAADAAAGTTAYHFAGALPLPPARRRGRRVFRGVRHAASPRPPRDHL